MRSKLRASKQSGYLILECIIAISCLAGLALLVLSMLQLREPLIAQQYQQREQLQQNYQQQQHLLQTADQHWLLEMQRGPL